MIDDAVGASGSPGTPTSVGVRRGQRPEERRLGVLAGAGQLPIEAVRELAGAGRQVFVVGFDRVSSPALAQHSDSFVSLVLGELLPLLTALRHQGCQELLLVGRFEKSLLSSASSPLRPDALALELLARVRDRSEDGLMATLASWLEAEGFELADQRRILHRMRVPPGVLTRARPSEAALRDLAAGRPHLERLGRQGEGQCLVVKDQRLFAQETAAGTDEAIRRGGAAAGAGSTVIKATRSGQDLRFDLPTIGPGTIEAMAAVGAQALAVEADATLIVDRARCLAAADRAGIAIWGFESERDEPSDARATGSSLRKTAS
jgi:DUF1009 family protein